MRVEGNTPTFIKFSDALALHSSPKIWWFDYIYTG